MAYLAPINKKDKQAGIIGAAILLILLLLMLFFTSMKQVDPPYPTKEVVMVMDFTDAGGGSAGRKQRGESRNFSKCQRTKRRNQREF